MFWRWAIASLALLVIFAIIFAGMGGRSGLKLLGQLTVTLWTLMMFGAIAIALRARYGRYRLMLVSAEADLTAFD